MDVFDLNTLLLFFVGETMNIKLKLKMENIGGDRQSEMKVYHHSDGGTLTVFTRLSPC